MKDRQQRSLRKKEKKSDFSNTDGGYCQHMAANQS